MPAAPHRTIFVAGSAPEGTLTGVGEVLKGAQSQTCARSANRACRTPPSSRAGTPGRIRSRASAPGCRAPRSSTEVSDGSCAWRTKRRSR